jgi:hypothetical protein
MVPFALLARRGCSAPCGLALALAAEFAPVWAARADLALDEMSAWLVGARHDPPADQLSAVVDPAAGAVRDAGTLDQAVSWQCCHQVAARILNRIGERADRVGNVVWALRAAELRLALPFDGPTRERLELDLRRVRARLN